MDRRVGAVSGVVTMKSETLMAQKAKPNLGSKASRTASGVPNSARSAKSATTAGKDETAKAFLKKLQAGNVATKPVAAKSAQSKPSATAKPSASKASAPAKGATTSKPASAKPVAAAPKPAPATKPALKAAPIKPAPRAAAQPQPARAMPANTPEAPKITGPAPGTQKAPAAAAPKPADKPAAAKADKPAASSPRHGFKVNEFVVYPTQGVGKVIGIEEEEIAGMKLELFKIEFEKERLVLRVPMGKVQAVGMRKLADDATVKKALETLKGRARVKRTMWSRRAQEYVAKINSGDLISIAEVVRDLYRSEAQPEQSYSERQLYEDALERMAREVAAVERLDERGAVQRITEILSKSAKGRAATAETPDSDGDAKAA